MVCLITGFGLICLCGRREDLQVEDGSRCHPRAGMEEGHRCETAVHSTTGGKSVTRVSEEMVTLSSFDTEATEMGAY